MATPRVTEDGVRKRAHVVALRRQRYTFDEIAGRLGISQARASQLYRSALAAIPASDLEQHRAEEQVLIDDAIASLMVIARDDTVTARVKVEAWNGIRGWAERKARLLGLDAPKQEQVITLDAIDTEIARLTAELDQAPRSQR